MRMSWYLGATVALVVANVFVYQALLAPHALTAQALPVGEGQALLIHTPEGEYALIDTGKDAAILRALGETLPPWERTLEMLVLTEMSSSAAGGAADVISRYRVHTLLRPETPGSRTLETALADALLYSPETRVLYAEQGMQISIGSVSFDILWPSAQTAGTEDGLVALRIRYGDTALPVYGALPERVLNYLALPPENETGAAFAAPGLQYVSNGREKFYSP